jgi:hypothetical protein
MVNPPVVFTKSIAALAMRSVDSKATDGRPMKSPLHPLPNECVSHHNKRKQFVLGAE